VKVGFLAAKLPPVRGKTCKKKHLCHPTIGRPSSCQTKDIYTPNVVMGDAANLYTLYALYTQVVDDYPFDIRLMTCLPHTGRHNCLILALNIDEKGLK
jgi:hypothetical protein